MARAGADGILIADGGESAVADARIPETVSMAFSFDDTFDIGEDSASAVGDYQSPFPFTGVIRHIDFDIFPDKLRTTDRHIAMWHLAVTRNRPPFWRVYLCGTGSA